MENLLNCQGKRFWCRIEGIETEGRITVENSEVFLCQNEKEGYPSEDKQGYYFSWIVKSGNKFDLENNDVTDFQLLEDEEEKRTYTEEDMREAFEAGRVHEGSLAFGCSDVVSFEKWLESYNNKEEEKS